MCAPLFRFKHQSLFNIGSFIAEDKLINFTNVTFQHAQNLSLAQRKLFIAFL